MGIDTSVNRRIGPNYLKNGCGGLCLFGISLFLFYIAFTQTDPPVPWQFMAFSIFSFIGSLLFAYILSGGTYIELNPLNFTIVFLGRKKTLRWDDVKFFTFQNSGKFSMIIYAYSKEYFERYPEKVGKRVEEQVLNDYQLTSEELVEILNAYKKRYAPHNYEE